MYLSLLSVCTGSFWFLKLDLFLWCGGQQSALKPGVIPPKAFCSKPFGARKARLGNVVTGAIGLTAPKAKAGGIEGLVKGKVPIPALGADVILCDGLLFTFASSNFKLFFTSGFCPDTLASL